MPGRVIRRLHLDGIPVSQWLQALLVGAVVGALVANIIAVVLLLDNSDKARQQRAAQLAQGRLLVECTTRPDLRKPPIPLDEVPPGDCYARQQLAQGDLLGKPEGPLKPYIAAAAACGAAHPGDYGATRRCVVAALPAP